MREDETIVCWGNVPSWPAVGVKSLSSRGMDSCAVLWNDRVHCWGRGAARSAPSIAAKQVAVGDGHACALRFDDTITCWGSLPW
jgi:hypothetical protein